MHKPFKNLPRISVPHVEAKNFTVLKISGSTGKPIKTLMICLTKNEAEGVARAANRFSLKKGVKDYFRVKEEGCLMVVENRNTGNEAI